MTPARRSERRPLPSVTIRFARETNRVEGSPSRPAVPASPSPLRQERQPDVGVFLRLVKRLTYVRAPSDPVGGAAQVVSGFSVRSSEKRLKSRSADQSSVTP